MSKTEAQALIVIRAIQEGKSIQQIRKEWNWTLRED